jgi:hypothetical protein
MDTFILVVLYDPDNVGYKGFSTIKDAETLLSIPDGYIRIASEAAKCKTITVYESTLVPDTIIIKLGEPFDLEIYHTGHFIGIVNGRLT